MSSVNKQPVPIIDKNGKQTTVHKNIIPSGSESKRSLPSLSHLPLEKGSAAYKVNVALAHYGIKSSRDQLTKVIAAVMGKPSAPNGRYHRIISTIGSQYNVSKSLAHNAATKVMRDLGLGDEIVEVSHSAEMNKSAQRLLVKNFGVRYTPSWANPEAVVEMDESHQTFHTGSIVIPHAARIDSETHYAVADNAARVGAIDPQKLFDDMTSSPPTTVELVNALMNPANKENLDAIYATFDKHGLYKVESACYQLLTILNMDISPDDKLSTLTVAMADLGDRTSKIFAKGIIDALA